MAFDLRQRGQIIRHLDPNQYGQYLAGSREEIVSRAGSSTSLYADSVAQRDTTNGYVYRAGYGTAGFETWMLDVTKTRSIVRNLAVRGLGIFDVEAFGAVGDGSTDDTQKIQDCIDYVKTLIGLAANSNYSGVTIRFNALKYAVSSLDCTFLHNVHFMGAGGDAGTRFVASKQTSGVHSSTGKAVFDAAATASCKWSNILVDSSTASLVPMAGWLFAGTGATGTNCTKNQMVNCGSFGKFQVAPMVSLYSSDHVFVGCGWQQWKIDRPAILVGNVQAASTGTVTSVVGNSGSAAPNTFPPTVSATGGGDLTFIGCEGHHMPVSGGETAPYNTGNGFAMIIAESVGVRYVGGNLASEGTGILLLGDGSGTTGPVVFSGTQFYSDDGTYTASNGVVVASGATVDGLILDGVNWASVPASGGSLIRLNDQSVLTNSEMRKPTVNYSAGTRYAFNTASYATGAIDCIKNSELDCVGFDVDISTGTGPRFGAGTVLNNIRNDALTKDSGVDYSVRWGTGNLAICSGGTGEPAASGTLRFQKASSAKFRNNAANADLRIWETNASDQILIGDTGVAAVAIDAASSGSVIISNAGANKIQANSTGLGFFNVTPVGRSSAYSVTNPTTDRALNVTADTTAQVAQVLGTLITDLQLLGLIG